MNDATLGVIGTIAGTLLGFLLGEVSSHLRERRATKQQAAAIRRLLTIDIETTLDSFNNLIGYLQQLKPSDPFLITHSISPVWNIQTWTSQPSLLTIALSADEIEKVYIFYSNHEIVIDYMRKLDSTDDPKEFDQVKQLALATTQEMLSLGNPLSQSATRY